VSQVAAATQTPVAAADDGRSHEPKRDAASQPERRQPEGLAGARVQLGAAKVRYRHALAQRSSNTTSTPRGNFTTLELTPGRTCPDKVPQWGMPRADLLSGAQR
jgi:hypothetical protein